MNVAGTTQHFLIGSEACSTERKLVSGTLKKAKNLWSGNPQGAEQYVVDFHLAALPLRLVSLIF